MLIASSCAYQWRSKGLGSNFSLQVASIRDRAAIPALWASLTARQGGLAGLEPQAPQAVTLPGRGTFYRVLAGAFGSHGLTACSRSHPCTSYS